MVRERVHFIFGCDEIGMQCGHHCLSENGNPALTLIATGEDLTPYVGQYAEPNSAVTQAPQIEYPPCTTNPVWCEDNKVNEIWQRMAKYEEQACKNPEYDGFTADEIMDSLFPSEDQIIWEAAGGANVEHEIKPTHEEERAQWDKGEDGGDCSGDDDQSVVTKSTVIVEGWGASENVVEENEHERPGIVSQATREHWWQFGYTIPGVFKR
ncbi:hypothetical protein HOY80DRAFT_1090811 [Tuber brumale]|nr:hypothetical protein HOY80DRAFT_1090811 [Tuber brumale]